MSALTEIFDYLYCYLFSILCFLFGLDIEFVELNESQSAIIDQIELNMLNFFPDIDLVQRPILLLFVGIFALGSIIGLVKRLFR